jgi:aminoglycoside 3-N-acetyltransferase
VTPEARWDRESLAADLRVLGVKDGQILLVHASMRRLSNVSGGAAAVVVALRDVLGCQGTLVVPTGTPGNSDTSRLYVARTARMTAEQISRYKAKIPPFDQATTPSEGMGQIAEQVRTAPGAVRSAHPQSSFAALGPVAHRLMDGHRPDCHLGEYSPLARLYEAGAWILLLGVGYAGCSAFHLAEYRYVPDPPKRTYRCVISVEGEPVWWEYQDVVLDDSDLDDIGLELDQAGPVRAGCVGAADCRLIPLVPAVDLAVEWLRRHRRGRMTTLRTRSPGAQRLSKNLEKPVHR